MGDRLIDYVTHPKGCGVIGPFQPVTFVPRTNYRQPCLPRVNRASAKSAREILDRGSKDWKNWEGNRR